MHTHNKKNYEPKMEIRAKPSHSIQFGVHKKIKMHRIVQMRDHIQQKFIDSHTKTERLFLSIANTTQLLYTPNIAFEWEGESIFCILMHS